MTSPHDYVTAGLRIVPCDVISKRPTLGGFGADSVDFCADPDEFDQNETPAILCGPCPAGGDDWLVCLDLDGGLALRDVEQHTGPLPETLTSHSGNHVFYWVPPGEGRDLLMQWTDIFGARRKDDKATGRKAPALDVKWCGGYAIERDDWDGGFDVDRIATLPEPALAAIIANGRKTNVRAEKVDVPLATDGTFNDDGLENDGRWDEDGRIQRFLETRPTDTQGDGGAGLFSVCCQLRAQFRLDSQTMFEALQAFYVPRVAAAGAGEWLDSDLWHKIEDSRAGSLNGGWVQGEMIPQQVREELKNIAGKEAPKETAEASGWIDVAFDTDESLKIDWTCEGLAITPGRPCMLYADPHAGKTTVQAELALAFATGSKAFGSIDVGNPRPVICIECEDDFDLRHHIGVFRAAHPTLEPGMLTVSSQPIFHNQVEVLQALFSAVEGRGIIFLNSLRAYTPGLEENSSDFAGPLLQLAGLSRKYQVPVWINHHTNKAGGVRGTSAIEAAAGNSWTLTVDEDTRTMTHSASRMCRTKLPFQLKFSGNALTSSHLESTKNVKRTVESAMAKLQARLMRANRWVQRSELTADMSVKKDDIAAALAGLVDGGKIARKSEGSKHSYHWNPKMDPRA